MNTDNKTPLWKQLNEARTQGEWRTEVYILISYKGMKNICNMGIANFLPANEVEANANYTALAVNNLHHLAEALELIKENCTKTFMAYAASNQIVPAYILNTLGAISETVDATINRIS